MEFNSKDSAELYGLLFDNDQLERDERLAILERIPSHYDQPDLTKLAMLVEVLSRPQALEECLVDEVDREILGRLLNDSDQAIAKATQQVIDHPIKHITTLKTFYSHIPDIPEMYAFLRQLPEMSLHLGRVLTVLLPHVQNLKELRLLKQLGQTIGSISPDHSDVAEPLLDEVERREIEFLSIASGSGEFSIVRTQILLQEAGKANDEDTVVALLGLMNRNAKFLPFIIEEEGTLDLLNAIFDRPWEFMLNRQHFQNLQKVVQSLQELKKQTLVQKFINLQSDLLAKVVVDPRFGTGAMIREFFDFLEEEMVYKERAKRLKEPLQMALKKILKQEKKVNKSLEQNPLREIYLFKIIDLYMTFEELTNLIDFLEKFATFFREMDREELKKKIIRMQQDIFPQILAARRKD